MTFIEFTEKVLGMELLDWQKAVLERVQKCKDEGKSVCINTYTRQGKTLLNNCIQQKLGYDRGFEDGRVYEQLQSIEDAKTQATEYLNALDKAKEEAYQQAFEELKGLLRCNNRRRYATRKCDGIYSIDSDICRSCENFGIPYSLLAEWQKEDKSTIIIDEWLQSPSQTLKKEADKFVEILEETSSIKLPEKEEK